MKYQCYIIFFFLQKPSENELDFRSDLYDLRGELPKRDLYDFRGVIPAPKSEHPMSFSGPRDMNKR